MMLLFLSSIGGSVNIVGSGSITKIVYNNTVTNNIGVQGVNEVVGSGPYLYGNVSGSGANGSLTFNNTYANTIYILVENEGVLDVNSSTFSRQGGEFNVTSINGTSANFTTLNITTMRVGGALFYYNGTSLIINVT